MPHYDARWRRVAITFSLSGLILALLCCELLRGAAGQRALRLFPYLPRPPAPVFNNATNATLAPPSFYFELVLPPGYNVSATSAPYVPRVRPLAEEFQSRSVVVILAEDAFNAAMTPLFLASALLFSARQQRHEAPFGFATHSAIGSITSGIRVRIVNATCAVIEFPQQTLYEAKTLEEDVQMVIDGSALVSSRPMGPAGLRFSGATDPAQLPAWTVFYAMAAVPAVFLEPAAAIDLQLLIMSGHDACSRAYVRRTASGCLRFFAPLSWSDDPPATTLFLSSFLVTIAQVVAFAVEFFLVSGREVSKVHAGLHYTVAALVCAAGSVGTWRQLFRPEGALYIVLGLVGLVCSVVAPLGLLVLWRVKLVQRARFYRYEWFPLLTRVRRFVHPNGFWGPHDFATTQRPMIHHLAPRSLSMAIFPFFLLSGFGVILGAQPESPHECSARFVVLALWFAFAALFCAVTRHHRTELQSALAAATYFSMSLACLGSSLQAARSSLRGTALQVTAAVMTIIAIFVRVAFAAVLRYREARWMRRALCTGPGASTTCKSPPRRLSQQQKESPTATKAAASADRKLARTSPRLDESFDMRRGLKFFS